MVVFQSRQHFAPAKGNAVTVELSNGFRHLLSGRSLNSMLVVLTVWQVGKGTNESQHSMEVTGCGSDQSKIVFFPTDTVHTDGDLVSALLQ